MTSAFHVMAKPRGAICNLDCRYCYYLEKERLYPGSNFQMADEMLDGFIRQYIGDRDVPEVTFTWQGGEPTLLGIDFFRRAVAYQARYRRPGMRIFNALQTNGTTLNDRWCRFFRENDFLIGISLDGPRHLHDAYRRDKGGRSTFDRVMAGLTLLKKHKVEFNILTCVSAANVEHPLEVYRFLRDEIGARFIQFIPIVEREAVTGLVSGGGMSESSIAGKPYGDFLITLFDEWVRRDVGNVFIQLFDTALGKWLGMPGGLCIFEENCGAALAMEHNGDLYSCDHYVDPAHRLGNIMETDMMALISSDRQRRFGRAKSHNLPVDCLECEVRFACNGGCPKNRLARSPDGKPGLNHLCEGYRAFFHHIDRPMRIMAGLIRQARSPQHRLRDQALSSSCGPGPAVVR